MKRGYQLIFFSFFFTTIGYAQINFRADLEAADLVKKGSVIPASQKLGIHENYLKQALANKDLQKQLYANIFLSEDKIAMQDFLSFAHYVIQAENLAEASGNKAAQGFLKIKLGWVDLIVHVDMRAAIKKTQMGIQFCSEAKDSFCVARGMEQMATLYSRLEMFDSSHYYFKLAISLLKKFPSGNVASVYNNYSNLLLYEGRSEEGLPFIDTAISIAKSQHETRIETIYLNNRAALLSGIKQFPEAIRLLQKCIATNEQNGWLDNLVYNYEALAGAYYEIRNYKQAYDFAWKHRHLKDSLTGESVKNNISNLTLENEKQKEELALKSSRLELVQYRYAVQKRNILIISILVLGIAGITWGRYRLQSRKRKLQQHQKSLAGLTQLLLQKNSQLTAMQEQLDKVAIAEPEPVMEKPDSEPSLYNQRILTHADWNAFKTHFEKAYPGYLVRLRTAYSNLSEAEERLFLFIKLNLKNTEIADILGISADSVKKTRTRLRKRLELPIEIQTDDFIKRF